MSNSQDSDDTRQTIAINAGSKTCADCGRSFARREHLLRHERTHTQEKPFACPNCNQRFQRQDAQMRHTTKFCCETTANLAVPSSASRKRKIMFACDACHFKKQKCNGHQPCSFCSKRSLTCSYARDASVRDVANSASELHSANFLEDGRDIQTDPNTTHRNVASVSSTAPSATQLEGSYAMQQSSRDLSQFEAPVEWSSTNLFQPLGPNISDASPSFDPLFQSTNPFSENQAAQNVPSIVTDMQTMSSGDFWSEGPYGGSWEGSTYLPDVWLDNFDFMLSDTLVYEESISSNPPFENLFKSGFGDSFGLAPVTDPATATALLKLQENTQLKSYPASDELIQWLNYSPALDYYSKRTINSFLNYFLINLTPTFLVFEGFRIKKGTLPELTLAMAAVGGLFCKVRGSFIVARAMYNDAQRMLVTRMYSNQSDSTDSEEFKLAVVQTCILFELFGLFGGDKRNYEYCQAFHMQMIQAVHEYRLLSSTFANTAEQEISRKRVLDGIRLIECYRVLLLQLPPNIFLIGNSDTFSASDPAFDASESTLFAHMKDFMTPDSPLKPISCPYISISSLAALTALSWHATPTGPGRPQSSRLWGHEMFDLALNKWVRSHQIPIDPATMILFHTNSIIIHTNMTHIHGLARLHLQYPDRSHALPNVPLRQWATASDCATAKWHAEKVIQLAKEISSPKKNSRHGKDIETGQGGVIPAEAPHVAICTYYAYLILWTATVTSKDSTNKSAAGILDGGIESLSRCKVRVADVLKNVLQSLLIGLDHKESAT